MDATPPISNLSFPACGVTIADPLKRLNNFLTIEYAWYDAFVDNDSDELLPFDVLVAVGINAFVGPGQGGVANLRNIHEGMARLCAPLLPALPPSQELSATTDVGPLVELVLEGTYTKGALAAVVTKVLHRKRRSLVPILDQYIAKAYVGDKGWGVLADSAANRERYQQALEDAIKGIQEDLRLRHIELSALAQTCSQQGWPITELRIHDILAWTETEPNGYYRR